MEVMKEVGVDELMNLRLRDQELALRKVITAFGRLHQRGAGLGSGHGWFGPASAAYDAGLDLLRAELQLAHQRLVEALQDTASAVVAVSAGESRGG